MKRKASENSINDNNKMAKLLLDKKGPKGGDASASNETMAQMLGVLMARVDFLEKELGRSKTALASVNDKILTLAKMQKSAGATADGGNGTNVERKISKIIENVKINDERLAGLRIRTKTVMSRLDKLEESKSSSTSNNNDKN